MLTGNSCLQAQNPTDSLPHSLPDSTARASDSGHARVELIEDPSRLQQLRDEVITKEKEDARRNTVRIVVGIAAVAIIVILLIRKRRRSS